MAIVSGISIDDWQVKELRKVEFEDELHLVEEPDGRWTVDNGDMIVLEFVPETVETERFGQLGWSVYDVMSMLEDDEGDCPITEEQARDFLIHNEKYLRDYLCERGFEALRIYAEQDNLTGA